MRWIRQYTLYSYLKQRYHRRSLIIVALVFVFCYILAWLSPVDSDKIFAELVTSIGEWLFALIAIVTAVVVGNKKSDSTTHVLHSQWLSYQQIFIAHRSVGATVLLYLCAILCLGLLVSTVFGILASGIVLLSLYIWLKILLLYTIIFVLAHHILPIIAAVFGLALYILFYSIGLIQSRSQSLGGFAQDIVSILIYISPQFVSIGQNTPHIDWLSANIFTIVISYGIYILCLLILGMQNYARTSWK